MQQRCRRRRYTARNRRRAHEPPSPARRERRRGNRLDSRRRVLPRLLVQGDNRAGLGHALARAIADAGINIHFLVAQVIGNRYSAVVGFGSEDEATRAVGIIKKAGSAHRR